MLNNYIPDKRERHWRHQFPCERQFKLAISLGAIHRAAPTNLFKFPLHSTTPIGVIYLQTLRVTYCLLYSNAWLMTSYSLYISQFLFDQESVG